MRVALFALALVGCTSVVVRYSSELDKCIAKGQAARSVAVYESCARAVDRTFCVTEGYLCDAGAR